MIVDGTDELPRIVDGIRKILKPFRQCFSHPATPACCSRVSGPSPSPPTGFALLALASLQWLVYRGVTHTLESRWEKEYEKEGIRMINSWIIEGWFCYWWVFYWVSKEHLVPKGWSTSTSPWPIMLVITLVSEMESRQANHPHRPLHGQNPRHVGEGKASRIDLAYLPFRL